MERYVDINIPHFIGRCKEKTDRQFDKTKSKSFFRDESMYEKDIQEFEQKWFELLVNQIISFILYVTVQINLNKNNLIVQTSAEFFNRFFNVDFAIRLHDSFPEGRGYEEEVKIRHNDQEGRTKLDQAMIDKYVTNFLSEYNHTFGGKSLPAQMERLNPGIDIIEIYKYNRPIIIEYLTANSQYYRNLIRIGFHFGKKLRKNRKSRKSRSTGRNRKSRTKPRKSRSTVRKVRRDRTRKSRKSRKPRKSR